MTIRDDWINRYEGKTRNQARISLRAFDMFVNVKFSKNEEMLVSHCNNGVEQNRYLMLDSMVQYWLLDLEFAPATIRNYFSFIRSYLRRYGIKTYKEDLREFVKLPKKVKERKEPLSKDTAKRIVEVSDPKYKMFWIFLIATGMRIGEVVECKKSWLDFSLLEEFGLVLIKIPALFGNGLSTKEKTERYTFLTGQAWQLVKPYYESRLLETDPLLDISYDAAEQYMYWVREQLGLVERYSTGVHKVTIHSFRSVTRTALSDKCGMEFSFYILGQEGYLSEYYRKDYVEAAKLYKIAEPELTL
jgi:integrase